MNQVKPFVCDTIKCESNKSSDPTNTRVVEQLHQLVGQLCQVMAKVRVHALVGASSDGNDEVVAG